MRERVAVLRKQAENARWRQQQNEEGAAAERERAASCDALADDYQRLIAAAIAAT